MSEFRAQRAVCSCQRFANLLACGVNASHIDQRKRSTVGIRDLRSASRFDACLFQTQVMRGNRSQDSEGSKKGVS